MASAAEEVAVAVVADTVAIHYRSVGRKVIVEILELDDHRRVIRGCACHGADA
jgi:hypothetical protein